MGRPLQNFFWAFDAVHSAGDVVVATARCISVATSKEFQVETKTGDRCIRNWFELIGNEKNQH